MTPVDPILVGRRDGLAGCSLDQAWAINFFGGEVAKHSRRKG